MRPATGKCLHYYFYFIDAELGLIYLRVPTWTLRRHQSCRRYRRCSRFSDAGDPGPEHERTVATEAIPNQLVTRPVAAELAGRRENLFRELSAAQLALPQRLALVPAAIGGTVAAQRAQ